MITNVVANAFDNMHNIRYSKYYRQNDIMYVINKTRDIILNNLSMNDNHDIIEGMYTENRITVFYSDILHNDIKYVDEILARAQYRNMPDIFLFELLAFDLSTMSIVCNKTLLIIKEDCNYHHIMMNDVLLQEVSFLGDQLLLRNDIIAIDAVQDNLHAIYDLHEKKSKMFNIPIFLKEFRSCIYECDLIKDSYSEISNYTFHHRLITTSFMIHLTAKEVFKLFAFSQEIKDFILAIHKPLHLLTLKDKKIIKSLLKDEAALFFAPIKEYHQYSLYFSNLANNTLRIYKDKKWITSSEEEVFRLFSFYAKIGQHSQKFDILLNIDELKDRKYVFSEGGVVRKHGNEFVYINTALGKMIVTSYIDDKFDEIYPETYKTIIQKYRKQLALEQILG